MSQSFDVVRENETGISRRLVEQPNPRRGRRGGQHIHSADPLRVGEMQRVEYGVGQKTRPL
jgi:hypothetical protein